MNFPMLTLGLTEDELKRQFREVAYVVIKILEESFSKGVLPEVLYCYLYVILSSMKKEYIEKGIITAKEFKTFENEVRKFLRESPIKLFQIVTSEK
jgi:hypothetical protein